MQRLGQMGQAAPYKPPETRYLGRVSAFKDARRRFERLSIRRSASDSYKLTRRSRRQWKSSLQVRSAATSEAVQRDTTVAEAGDHVVVNYKACLEDGTVVDDTSDREPLEFVIGSNKVIQGMSSTVTGLSLGQTTSRSVPPEEAFGEWRKEMLAEIPEQDVKQKLKAGDGLRLSNGLQAVVHKIENGTITIDANTPLAGKRLKLDVELMRLTKAENFEQATFGAGCFWGPELLFSRLPGILQTEVGYCQGTVEKATYEDVCSGLSGHNEVVQVTFDPSVISYKQLLKNFTEGHNPTQKNGQGRDIGSQYRSGVYAHNPQQKQEAAAHLAEIQTNFQDPIATEVEDLKNYNMAEEYHQQYLSRGGRFGNAQSSKKGCTDPIRCYG